MWFGSHFTVAVTRLLLLSSRVSLLVINLLTIRERVKTCLHVACEQAICLGKNSEEREGKGGERAFPFPHAARLKACSQASLHGVGDPGLVG